MSFDINSVAADPQLIENGAPVTVFPGWRCTIRSTKSAPWRARADTMARADAHRTPSPDEVRARTNRGIAEVLVVGWDDAKFDGEELPCTPENVLRVLNDPRFPDLRERLLNAALDLDNFRPAQQMAAAR